MESTEQHVSARQPGMPYREDCWSDGETSALVDAWGERYLELNRGSLRQKQWQEVADAVNSRAAMTRRKIRTDVQCKNRIDTLKKKYKQEKAKIVDGTALTSQWPFYSRLDVLIGAATLPAGSGSGSGGIKRPSFPQSSPSPPLALPLPFHRKGSMPLPSASPLRIGNKLSALPLATALPVNDSFIRKAAAAAAAAPAGTSSFPIASSFIRKTPPLPHLDSSFIRKTPPPVRAPSLPMDNYFIRKAVAAAAAAKQEAITDSQEDQEDDQSESNSERRSVSSLSTKRGKKRKPASSSSSDGIMELARAIDKMGKMYERMEETRQRETMEMEKQRMELIKRMELQRMQIFADLKVQTERIRRSDRLSIAGELIGSVSAVSFLMNPSLI